MLIASKGKRVAKLKVSYQSSTLHKRALGPLHNGNNAFHLQITLLPNASTFMIKGLHCLGYESIKVHFSMSENNTLIFDNLQFP